MPKTDKPAITDEDLTLVFEAAQNAPLPNLRVAERLSTALTRLNVWVRAVREAEEKEPPDDK